MQSENFCLDEYLRRINCNAKPEINFEFLKQISQASLTSIVFENTQVQAQQIPSLVPRDIVNRIIKNKRGGYCYEINGLFAMALEHIGFKWYFVAVRPMFYKEKRPKTHVVIIVEIENKSYLCDCGFGGHGIRYPIEIKDHIEEMQCADRFKIEIINKEYVLSALVNNEWLTQYGFELIPQDFIEFNLANYFNATHPDTIFTQKKLAIMQTENGRKILVDNELKIIDGENMQKITVEYNAALKEYFGLQF